MDSLSIASIATAFGAGLLSFFSPCTLPVLPVYMGILASHASDQRRLSRFIHAIFFVLGLSTVLFLLGFGAGAFGELVQSPVFKVVIGLIVVLLGIYATGFISIPALEKEWHITTTLFENSSFIGSFVLGAAFSLSWTPCVGPVLAAVLAIAAQEGGSFVGGTLLLVYALGLGIPFLMLALGSDQLLQRIKQMGPVLPKLKAIGGSAIAAVGLWMIVLNVQPQTLAAQTNTTANKQINDGTQVTADEGLNFTLTTLDGDVVSLADFRGKPVVMKFWASWCGPCRVTLPEYQELYEEFSESGEAVLLSAVTPGMGDLDEAGFRELMDEEGYSFPVLLDDGRVFNQFGIRAYPTYIFFDVDGNIAETQTGDPGKTVMRAKLAALAHMNGAQQEPS